MIRTKSLILVFVFLLAVSLPVFAGGEAETGGTTTQQTASSGSGGGSGIGVQLGVGYIGGKYSGDEWSTYLDDHEGASRTVTNKSVGGIDAYVGYSFGQLVSFQLGASFSTGGGGILTAYDDGVGEWWNSEWTVSSFLMGTELSLRGNIPAGPGKVMVGAGSSVNFPLLNTRNYSYEDSDDVTDSSSADLEMDYDISLLTVDVIISAGYSFPLSEGMSVYALGKYHYQVLDYYLDPYMNFNGSPVTFEYLKNNRFGVNAGILLKLGGGAPRTTTRTQQPKTAPPPPDAVPR
jgi:hypothetical protein